MLLFKRWFARGILALRRYLIVTDFLVLPKQWPSEAKGFERVIQVTLRTVQMYL